MARIPRQDRDILCTPTTKIRILGPRTVQTSRSSHWYGYTVVVRTRLPGGSWTQIHREDVRGEERYDRHAINRMGGLGAHVTDVPSPERLDAAVARARVVLDEQPPLEQHSLGAELEGATALVMAARQAARDAVAVPVGGPVIPPLNARTHHEWRMLSDGRYGRFVMLDGGRTVMDLVVDTVDLIGILTDADWIYERLGPYLGEFPAEASRPFVRSEW